MMMASRNAVDVRGTGVSAQDRALTISRLVDPERGPQDFVHPGHVTPLQAQPGGVLRRAGHTEAAIDVARLAGAPNAPHAPLNVLRGAPGLRGVGVMMVLAVL